MSIIMSNDNMSSVLAYVVTLLDILSTDSNIASERNSIVLICQERTSSCSVLQNRASALWTHVTVC